MITHDYYHKIIKYIKDEKIVSTLLYNETDKNFHIVYLSTNIKYRKQSYATQLLKYLIQLADENNKTITLIALSLSDDIDNEVIVKFYEKFGFIKDKHFLDNENRMIKYILK